MKISACVIAKNEALNLPRWIECMKKIADEIIVVDTGSTDQTVMIAERSGAIIYRFEWCNDFAAAKNFALSKVSGDWVLFLDADEYFTESSIVILRDFLMRMNANRRIDAFFCRLINIDVDDHNRFISAVESLRIFRNSKMLHFIGSVHEHLIREGGPLRIAKAAENIEICHTGYSRSIVRRKLERNLRLLQENIAIEGEQPWHYAYLADCYFELGDYLKAVEYAKKSIESKVVLLGQESKVYRRLIDAAVLGEMTEEEIMSFINMAITKFQGMPEFLWSKGEFFFSQKKYVDAELWVQQSIDLYHKQEKNDADGDFSGKLTFAYCTLGKISVLKDDLLAGMEYYVEALQCYKYNLFALQDLYGILRRQDPAEVIAFLRTLYSENKEDLEFIVSALYKYKADKVTLYYLQTLKNKYQIEEGDLAVAGFFSAMKYQQAAEYAMEEIKAACDFFVAAVVKDGKYEIQNSGQTILPLSYRNVLKIFLDKKEKNSILVEKEELLYEKIERIFRLRECERNSGR